jgi:hypothetical protein
MSDIASTRNGFMAGAGHPAAWLLGPLARQYCLPRYQSVSRPSQPPAIRDMKEPRWH